jgi:hypothetical protein
MGNTHPSFTCLTCVARKGQVTRHMCGRKCKHTPPRPILKSLTGIWQSILLCCVVKLCLQYTTFNCRVTYSDVMRNKTEFRSPGNGLKNNAIFFPQFLGHAAPKRCESYRIVLQGSSILLLKVFIFFACIRTEVKCKYVCKINLLLSKMLLQKCCQCR